MRNDGSEIRLSPFWRNPNRHSAILRQCPICSCGSEWIDAAFDAVDGPQVAVTAETIRLRGTIVIHGAPSNEPTQFPLKVALRKNLSLRGCHFTEITDEWSP
ncbi:hypothetical protein [uncultured Paracoccus sp.]|uniref:hypothetical protein n=1 Tax=uncultured Paracoccus sp. TaxID=189685 RepID=UPI002605E8A3|nr:hypothetical protein [uncultured Paracoccus sp.]